MRYNGDMAAPSSLVEVHSVNVDVAPPRGLLSKLTGRQAVPRSVLRDISFTVDSGEHGVVFGESGSGKSVLFRLLAGGMNPTRGTVRINGNRPQEVSHLAAGYVSPEESEPKGDTVQQVLYTFAKQHGLQSIPARLTVVAEHLDITHLASRAINTLSSTERLRVNIARAALSHSPLILFDDVLDQLGAKRTTDIIQKLFEGRTVLLATRSSQDAEDMNLPIALLHKGALVHFGRQQEIASKTMCPRTVNAWVEGLRYDLLRSLKTLPGVVHVRLAPTDQFEGQRLEVTVRSSRYLPALYDLISQAPLIKIEEEPARLSEILDSL